VRYLLDTNVWLEGIVSGSHSGDVGQLLRTAPQGWLASTDYVLHTVGIILARAEPAQFRSFLDDLIELKVFTLHLAPSNLYVVLDHMMSLGLDFDDAFQYFAAELNDLTIVSLDSDFDKTPRGRLTPVQALNEIRSRPTT
jgi:predicted nucleic acid-binding protein